MSRVGPKDHFWTYQPYLEGFGSYFGSYCDRCGKVRWVGGEIISHREAIRRVWELGGSLYRNILIENLICDKTGKYLRVRR